MREIKFRAKSLKDGEWHYGSLVKIPCTDENGNDFDRYEIIEVTPHFPMVHYSADPSTIGQCTGIKDCHGNDLWENDIVSFTTGMGDTETGIVAWIEQYGAFAIIGIEQEQAYDDECNEIEGEHRDNAVHTDFQFICEAITYEPTFMRLMARSFNKGHCDERDFVRIGDIYEMPEFAEMLNQWRTLFTQQMEENRKGCSNEEYYDSICDN